MSRLENQVVLLTGGAGNLGSHMSRRLLGEGARVVITGRSEEKLEAFIRTLVDEGLDRKNVVAAVGDCADSESCREVVAKAVAEFGAIDALINNAGSAGPKQTLQKLPFTRAQADRLSETETVADAAMNLLGGPWNMTRAAIPHLNVGGAIVNVSTIFSRTPYFGRIAYSVPKSGLNALSLGLAAELGGGPQAIRVNTLFPGPIESDRIETVFAAMDQLQGRDPGATGEQFRGLMLNRRADDDGEFAFRYPKPDDVAAAVAFLSSADAAAFSGHAFEATNGMRVPAQSRAKLVSWPDDRLVDLRDRVVLVLAGSDVADALTFADRNRQRGAEIILAFRSLEALGQARAQVHTAERKHYLLHHLDPLRPESLDRVFQLVDDQFGRIDGVIVLPFTGPDDTAHTLATATDEEVRSFIENEIVAPIAFASALAQRLTVRKDLRAAPAITFVTNPSDDRYDHFSDIKRAAVEELIRIWRYEEEEAVTQGARSWSSLPNQLVRFDNREDDNLAFAADWTATLNNRVRRMDPINLWIPKQILRATGKSATPHSIQRVLPGLHRGKTAVITGASLGIGMQLARYLALAGARVLLSAREPKKLDVARDQIVAELAGIGYPEPETRVSVMADVDVGDEDALQQLHTRATDLFEHVDFLINNAGISGAEEMVVDMSMDDWNRTLRANLVSNYSLIRKFAPAMKKRGSGRILNVSSYFGGEKYLAVAYPNRADYSVSKAGQRVLAEILSRHLGPEIQINAMAPGPVDGVRLRGSSESPGLFARRGRLILENKRLNEVHEAALESLAEGASGASLRPLAGNELEALLQWPEAPKPLAALFRRAGGQGGKASGSRYLMSADMMSKLIRRLVAAGHLNPEEAAAFVAEFKEPPEPFFEPEIIARAAQKIEAGILNRLHLHQMPTDEQVALSTVFSLADDIVSGETFHPSGGLKFDRSVTEGELMLAPGAEDLSRLNGKHVVLIGGAMQDELVAIANGFLEHDVATLHILCADVDVADSIKTRMHEVGNGRVHVRSIGRDMETAMDHVREQCGGINVVVSTPFTRLPLNALVGEPEGSWDRVLSTAQFAGVVRDQITHHFRVARRAALMPRCQIVLVTPDTSRASTREEFALALFVKNALHALTVTLGVEAERLPTTPAVNQVQLTRRARAEEPDNDQELAEEMRRLVAAVLQCSVPAPTPKESRYLSRIFRGNAVTV